MGDIVRLPTAGPPRTAELVTKRRISAWYTTAMALEGTARELVQSGNIDQAANIQILLQDIAAKIAKLKGEV